MVLLVSRFCMFSADKGDEWSRGAKGTPYIQTIPHVHTKLVNVLGALKALLEPISYSVTLVRFEKKKCWLLKRGDLRGQGNAILKSGAGVGISAESPIDPLIVCDFGVSRDCEMENGTRPRSSRLVGNCCPSWKHSRYSHRYHWKREIDILDWIMLFFKTVFRRAKSTSIFIATKISTANFHFKKDRFFSEINWKFCGAWPFSPVIRRYTGGLGRGDPGIKITSCGKKVSPILQGQYCFSNPV